MGDIQVLIHQDVGRALGGKFPHRGGERVCAAAETARKQKGVDEPFRRSRKRPQVVDGNELTVVSGQRCRNSGPPNGIIAGRFSSLT